MIAPPRWAAFARGLVYGSKEMEEGTATPADDTIEVLEYRQMGSSMINRAYRARQEVLTYYRRPFSGILDRDLDNPIPLNCDFLAWFCGLVLIPLALNALISLSRHLLLDRLQCGVQRVALGVSIWNLQKKLEVLLFQNLVGGRPKIVFPRRPFSPTRNPTGEATKCYGGEKKRASTLILYFVWKMALL